MKIQAIKIFSFSALLIAAIWLISSCSDTGREYMPDMAHTLALEPYGQNTVYADSMNARLPVAGTIPLYQGAIGKLSAYMPFLLPNDSAGYAAAKDLKSPVDANPANLQDGAQTFSIYCAVCHGPRGNSNGTIVVNAQLKHPFPPPPSYYSDQVMNMNPGQMFFRAHYGNGLMGSYATQINQEQMWKVVLYIQSMKDSYRDSVAKVAKTATIKADTMKGKKS